MFHPLNQINGLIDLKSVSVYNYVGDGNIVEIFNKYDGIPGSKNSVLLCGGRNQNRYPYWVDSSKQESWLRQEYKDCYLRYWKIHVKNPELEDLANKWETIQKALDKKSPTPLDFN